MKNVLLTAVTIFTCIQYANSAQFTADTSKTETLSSDTLRTKDAGDENADKTRSNYWRGATLAYNVDGADPGNIVGSAKVAINVMRGRRVGTSWAIVGNFGNFLNSSNTEDVNKNLKSITQSAQGLNVGISAVWCWVKTPKNLWPSLKNPMKDENTLLRIEVISGYRLNGFQNVGGDDSSNLVLNQWRTSASFEFESPAFGNGGRVLLSVEPSITIFDMNIYNEIFNKQKSAIVSLEATAIVPIAGNFGFLASGNFIPDSRPVFQFGVVIKPAI